MTSAIFLFIAGLNSFKNSFKFSQTNNSSRKTFFKGIIISIFPITLAMSIIDVIINRVYNLFVLSPMNYDMIYSSFRDTGMWNTNNTGFVWTQANNVSSLLGTIIWLFAVYSVFFLIGIFISLIYYRSNKLLKVIISVILIMLLMLSYNIYRLLPVSFWIAMGKWISFAFGWQSRNPYMAVASFTVIGIICAGFIYLLIRKAVAKE